MSSSETSVGYVLMVETPGGLYGLAEDGKSHPGQVVHLQRVSSGPDGLLIEELWSGTTP
jgi:hypothetical protein